MITLSLLKRFNLLLFNLLIISGLYATFPTLFEYYARDDRWDGPTFRLTSTAAKRQAPLLRSQLELSSIFFE